jgi:hypothetical protein
MVSSSLSAGMTTISFMLLPWSSWCHPQGTAM